MRTPIYLDYNATTPVDDRVLDAMLPFFREHFGNASSEHSFGWTADEAVKQARERTAKLIGATPRTLFFTSGATESVSLAIRGAGDIYGGRRHRIVTVQTEHRAVLATCEAMEREGYETTYLPVGTDGLVDLDALEAALNEETFLVSVMWANNETGVVQPIPEIAERAHRAGALMMTDATQAAGKLPISVNHDGVDLLALSAHKLYGPKGVGALYVRQRGPRVRLAPQVTGGGQEEGLRGGTLNVPGIVGLGMAAQIARRAQADDAERLEALRDRFEAAVCAAVPGTAVNGAGAPRLPNTTSLRFEGARAAQLLPVLHDVAASAGSACHAHTDEPSHVLTAMGLTPEQARATVRFSLGRPTTEAEVDVAAEHVAESVHLVRRRAAA
ncbi:cysteine desulfurase family protein [Rubrivirga sp.]|uniref:cysteine desulfurase family protein n=1 Tax=Rubrivirga sp. TaxID=1885344 RepID=UPI003B517B74